MNPQVDKYLIDGCMRCKLGATPACKVNHWKEELLLLRQIALDSGLTETIKWGVPCYTYNDKNIILIAAFKEYCGFSFPKGMLLNDKYQLLVSPGESSQSALFAKFTHANDIVVNSEKLKEYILQAIEVEKSGKKIEFKKNPEPIPKELLQKFDELPVLKKAFFDLTPGRQRGYIIYFSQPKQSSSRFNRIEKCIPKIMNGEGLNDHYKSK